MYPTKIYKKQIHTNSTENVFRFLLQLGSGQNLMDSNILMQIEYDAGGCLNNKDNLMP